MISSPGIFAAMTSSPASFASVANDSKMRASIATNAAAFNALSTNASFRTVAAHPSFDAALQSGMLARAAQTN